MSDPSVELVKNIVYQLCDDHDSVQINVNATESIVVIEVRAGKEIGKILGKGGKLAIAVRTILTAIGARKKIRYEYSVVE